MSPTKSEWASIASWSFDFATIWSIGADVESAVETDSGESPAGGVHWNSAESVSPVQTLLMLSSLDAARPMMRHATTAGAASDSAALRTDMPVDGAPPVVSGALLVRKTVSQLESPPTPTNAAFCHSPATRPGPRSTRPLATIHVMATM